MMVLKSGGRVVGGKLTNAEKKALDIELRKQLAEYTRKYEIEILSLVLRQLRRTFGFGEKRLRRYYDNFDKDIKDMIDRYEMEDCDDAWLCTEELKADGIDIEKWRKE